MTHLAAGSTPADRTRVVVVGNGMVGSRFVEETVARDTLRRLAITVLGDELYGPYNRVLLSDVVAGRADVAALALGRPGPLAEAGVDVRTGTAAVSVDRRNRSVLAADGSIHAYDLLVLATGAFPVVPPLGGLDRHGPPAGVWTFRTIDDCREIVAAAANVRTAVVLGGGVLGVEAARGLAARGLRVTLVHAGPHLLERQLDSGAGTVLAASLRRLGVDVRVGTPAASVETVDGQCRALLLADGQRLPVELLVLACGVRPDARLVPDLTGASGAIAVDDQLRALADPAVAAIGDCAEHRGVSAGLVAPGWDQARVLAELVAGTDRHARFDGARPVLRLKAADLDVAAAGDPEDLAADPWTCAEGTDVVQLVDPGRGSYVKAVLRDSRVVAATVVGAPRAASELLLLVDRGTPTPSSRVALLMPHERPPAAVTDDPTRIPDRATICRCNGVTKGAIVAAFEEGARTVEALAARTRATTGCGGCAQTCAGLLTWLADADAPARSPLPAPARDAAALQTVTTGGPR